jgi:rod shape-determining protein MreD
MIVTRATWVFVIALWLFGGLQQGLSSKIGIAGGRPDFLIILAVFAGLILPRRGALIVGFTAGLIHGALVGANMWQYVATKLFAAWLASLLIEMRFQKNVAVAGLSIFITTLITNLLFMFLTSQPDIGGFIKATIISAVYNGVVALMVYLPIERTSGTTNNS